MTHSQGTSRAGASRSFRMVLFLSLAVNLLILGLAAGFFLRGPGEGHRRAQFRGGEAPFMQALEPRDRRALAQSIATRRASPEKHRTRTRERFAGLVAALRADPFDPAALAALLSQQNDEADQRRRQGQDAFLALVEGKSAQERAAIAARLEAVLKKPRGGADARAEPKR